MTIFLTGDVHSDIQKRLNTRSFPEQKDLPLDGKNYVIVLGDFGVIWENNQTSSEKYLLKWLDEKPWITLFIDGNHENFNRLYKYPIVDFAGGKAHQISDSVYHLMRGEVYNIENNKIFTFGGAQSHDIDILLDPDNDINWKRKRKRLRQNYETFRVKGISWWEQEQANEEEKEHGIETLEKNNWSVDYVLTHTAPASILKMYDEDMEPDDTSIYLEEIQKRLDYKHWFFGHLHDNKNITKRDHLLYEYILELPSNT